MTTQVTPAASHPPDPAPPFVWERAPWGWVLTCPPLAQLARHGFTRFFFVNGHGGNIATVTAAFSEIYAERSMERLSGGRLIAAILAGLGAAGGGVAYQQSQQKKKRRVPVPPVPKKLRRKKKNPIKKLRR